MKIGDCVMVSLQAQAQGDWDVEAQVKMICFVVEESLKGCNGLRSDRAPTLYQNLLLFEFLYREHVSPASR